MAEKVLRQRDAYARELSDALRKAAAKGGLEKEFRNAIEPLLERIAADLGVELRRQKEVTLGDSGRADTIYNRFIVEWEKPRSLKPSNSASSNSHSIAQVKDYGDSLYWKTRERAGRIVCCCTDGVYLIFVTKPGREWITSKPVPVSEQSCRRFFDYFFALQSGVALLPEYLCEDFSAEHERSQDAVRALYKVLLDHEKSPPLEAVFTQWAQFFGAVTDYEQWRAKWGSEAELRKLLGTFRIESARPDLNRFFFATHTYFAVLTKLLAYVIIGRYTDLPARPLSDWKDLSDDELVARFGALEKGGPFKEAGIRNYLEGDFFAWYVRFFTPELAKCLRSVVARLAEYDPATLDLAPAPTQDLLKKLYHRLVSPQIRKALGEYYTPDWLAERLLNMLDGGTYRGEPGSRLLDPSCGSGTFLLLAINAVRRNAIAQSMEPGKLLRVICHNVVGIDLNPLAVIAARTNYLLALGPLLQHRGKELLEIPVYLADSIMTPSRGGDGLFDREKVSVLLSIGKVELPRRLATQKGVSILTNLLDKHLDSDTRPEDFLELVERELVDCGAKWDEDSRVVGTLYEDLFKLHAAGRNGLWARILKNAFAPVFLAPFDYVAGNPPWINWENMPEAYRNETKDLWSLHGLFVHKGMDTILGKGKKDISMLMTYVAADSYLKVGGKLGFLITQAVFKTSGAGQGFRRFTCRKGEPLEILWADDFSEMQLFEGATNRTSLFIMRKGTPTKYPIQYAYWRKKAVARGAGFDYDSTLQEVTEKTSQLQFVAEPVDAKDRTSAWLTGRPGALKAIRKVLAASEYKAHLGVNTGGANAVYWFEVVKDHADGTMTVRNVIEGAKRSVERVEVRLESELLYPLLRGGEVEMWKATPSICMLFPQDLEKRSGLSADMMKKEYPLSFGWLKRHEKMLRERAAYKRYFNSDKGMFWSMFDTGPYTMSKWKVAWPRIAGSIGAVVVGSKDGKVVLPQETVSFIGVDSLQEAEFISGVMNSTPFQLSVACFSQPGSKSFGTPSILEQARIPKYESGNSLHMQIASEAQKLGKAKSAEPDHERLDKLCAGLWGVDAAGLGAIHQMHKELFG